MESYIPLLGSGLAQSFVCAVAVQQEAIDELVKLVKQKNLSMWLERHAFSDVKHALARAEQPYKNYKVVMMMEK